MNCKRCNKEIRKGERVVEVSYGQVYDIHGNLDVVGDYFEYYHPKCYEKR